MNGYDLLALAFVFAAGLILGLGVGAELAKIQALKNGTRELDLWLPFPPSAEDLLPYDDDWEVRG